MCVLLAKQYLMQESWMKEMKDGELITPLLIPLFVGLTERNVMFEPGKQSTTISAGINN